MGRVLRAASRGVVVPDDVHDGLEQLARQTGVSLKQVLLAAHLRVLGGVTRRTRVVTGLMTNGRPERTDSERVVGMFLNVVPFEVSVQRSTWPVLVGRVVAAESELLPFRRFPLPHTRPQGELPFDTLFNFTQFHAYRALPDTTDLRVVGGTGFEYLNFALVANFNVDPGGKRLGLRLDYNDAALDQATIDDLATAYLRILGEAAEAGGVRAVAAAGAVSGVGVPNHAIRQPAGGR